MDGTGTESPQPARHHSAAPQHRLRQLWCQRSRQAGWNQPEDWWTPSVESLCTAVVERTDMEAGCVRFGQARARSGVTIGATLDDFAALSDVAGWPTPPRRLMKAVAEGWADVGRAQDDCRDPLTGLCTAAYLRTRIGEVYRSADPGDPRPPRHQLLVVALDTHLNPWRRMARLIALGYELRQVFRRGETLTLLSRNRIGVLAPADADLISPLLTLRTGLGIERGTDVWRVAFPDRYEEALALLDPIGGLTTQE